MFKAVFSVFSGNFIGKVIGLLREVIIAALYGISAPVGAFRLSQSATLIPVNFFTADSLNAGFIPLYNRYKKVSLEKAQSLFWLLNICLFIQSIFITFIIFYFSSTWVGLIAPGITKAEHELTVRFLQVMSIGVPFYLQSSLCAYLAAANNSYFLVSIRPTVQSIGMIGGVALAYYLDYIILFAWGFTISYFCLFFFSFYRLAKNGFLLFCLKNTKEIIIDFWKIIRPLLLLPIFLQGNIIVEKIVASFMGIKVVAAVEYVKCITETGLVLLAVPIGFVSLSVLSSLSMKKTQEKLKKIVPLILTLTIPVSFFLAINAELIISLLFKRGAFDNESVNLTKIILIGSAVGFWAQVVSYFLIKALNSNARNKAVVIYMACAVSANALFNIAFYKQFGPIVLGLSVSIYSIVLFVLAVRAYQMTTFLLPNLFWLFLGSVGYFFIRNAIIIEGSLNIIVSCFIFVVYWGGYIMAVSKLRESVSPLFKLLLKSF